MDIVFYIIIFILGTLLGSFYATAIQRISKKKRLLGVRSYCQNCGKKLVFFEKIPILSYIFLKGKCKHCNKKIKYSYIILEILTGALFLSLAYSFNLKITNINVTNLISFIFMIFYFSYIILTSGLDKENKNMLALVLAFGIIISLVYIIYSCIVDKTAVYENIAYLVVMALLLLLNIINAKKRAQCSYIIDLLTMLLIMLIFTQEITCIITIIGTLISIALYILINKIKKSKIKTKKEKTIFNQNVKIAYIMGILNIFTFIALINISI